MFFDLEDIAGIHFLNCFSRRYCVICICWIYVETREVSLKNYICEIYHRFDIHTIATTNWINFDSRYSKENTEYT